MFLKCCYKSYTLNNHFSTNTWYMSHFRVHPSKYLFYAPSFCLVDQYPHQICFWAHHSLAQCFHLHQLHLPVQTTSPRLPPGHAGHDGNGCSVVTALCFCGEIMKQSLSLFIWKNNAIQTAENVSEQHRSNRSSVRLWLILSLLFKDIFFVLADWPLTRQKCTWFPGMIIRINRLNLSIF